MKQVDPEIRRAQLEDATAITRCVAVAYRQYAARIGKPPAPMLDDYAELIQRHKVFVLAEGDNIIGVLVLIEKDQGFLLDNVAVNPAYQRRGLGRKLIEFAEAEALRLGFSASFFTPMCRCLKISISTGSSVLWRLDVSRNRAISVST